MRRTYWAITVILLGLAGCGRGPDQKKGPAVEPKASAPLMLFVAASTKDAIQEIATAFTGEKKVEVKINADDSSKLATQITKDAPAHVFLSANEKWADFVKDKGFAADSRVLLGNALVIVVPKGNPAGIKKAEDLTGAKVQRIALAGPTVPAGMYARQALKKLALLEPLEKAGKIVAGENVRVTLTYVERGETEAGIVYATDALISDKVEQVYAFDPSVHEPIRYPAVLLKEGEKHAAGRAFFEFLQSPAAVKVFRKHGFTFLDAK